MISNEFGAFVKELFKIFSSNHQYNMEYIKENETKKQNKQKINTHFNIK